MTPEVFPRANTVFATEPDAYKQSVCGEMLPVPVAVLGDEFVSAWRPDELELEKLKQGGCVMLTAFGGQPVLRVTVATAKDLELASPAAG